MRNKNLPNQLTMLRALLVPVFAAVLLCGLIEEQTARYIAVSIFVLASVTDFFDGYLARKYGLVTNFGKFMDPMADKLLVCTALVAMVELGDLPAWAVIIMIAREFVVSGFRLVASDAKIVIAADIWGKIKTVAQMAMVIVVLLRLDNIAAFYLGRLLIYASVALAVISAANYIIKNIGVLRK